MKGGYKAMKQKKRIPWWVIAIVFYFFFPAGIVLAVLKLRKETDRYKSNGKVVSFIGWFIFALGVFYLIMGITGQIEAGEGESVLGGVILMLAVCCGGGYALVRYGKKYQMLDAKSEKLFGLILNNGTGSLDTFAADSGLSYDDTVSHIQKWITERKLSDVRIDLVNRSLVSTIVKQTRTIECPNCGAMSTIVVGENHTCEYCGYSIN